jgi:hypothetical protein
MPKGLIDESKKSRRSDNHAEQKHGKNQRKWRVVFVKPKQFVPAGEI